MDHVDVFIYLTLIQEQYGRLTLTEMTQFINRQFQTEIEEDQIAIVANSMKTNPPPTQHLVHALKDKGFSPGFIAKYLQINPSTVSYHLSRPIKRDWQNARLTNLVQYGSQANWVKSSKENW